MARNEAAARSVRVSASPSPAGGGRGPGPGRPQAMASAAGHNHERTADMGMGAIRWRATLGCGALAVSLVLPPSGANRSPRWMPRSATALPRGIYPGAVVIIGRRDSLLYARGYGHFTWSPSSPVPTPDSTLWDIASITKVVSTASPAMRLVDRGKLDLDAPVRRYLPRFSGGLKNQVTVRMLLDHTSGLKSYVPFYLKARRSRSARHRPALCAATAAGPRRQRRVQRSQRDLPRPGSRKGLGLPLDRARRREVFGPLGMTQTMYQAAALAQASHRAQRHLARPPVPG